MTASLLRDRPGRSAGVDATEVGVMKPKDGGPAFPRAASDPQWGLGTESFEGMSLRDYFAGQALCGLLSDAGTIAVTGNASSQFGVRGPAILAPWCYQYADAMLVERAKERA